MYLPKISVLTAIIRNNIFSRSVYGGIFIKLHNMDMRFIGSIFTNNTSEKEAILIFGSLQYYAVSINLINCTFYGNSANSTGGAIHMAIYKSNQVTIINSSFVANTCKRGSGMYVIFHSKYTRGLKLINVTFQENSAENGGGVFIDNDNNQQIIIFENVTFRDNSAVNGGAIDMLHLREHSIFINNRANSTAGSIRATILLEGSVHLFENNSAWRNGGAILLSKSFLIIANGETYFTKNSASFGGALFVKDYSDLCNMSNYCYFRGITEFWQLSHFYNNVAIGGPILYGGFINNCKSGSGIQILAKQLALNQTNKHFDYIRCGQCLFL